MSTNLHYNFVFRRLVWHQGILMVYIFEMISEHDFLICPSPSYVRVLSKSELILKSNLITVEKLGIFLDESGSRGRGSRALKTENEIVTRKSSGSEVPLEAERSVFLCRFFKKSINKFSQNLIKISQ